MKIDSNALKQAVAMVAVQAPDHLDIDSDETGWHMRTMDPSHVSFSKADIAVEAFDEYVAQGIFSTDTSKLLKALKDKGDRPEIAIENGVLTVKGNGMTTKVRLLTPGEVRGMAREPECQARAVISSDLLRKIVKALDEDMGAIRISLTDAGISMEGHDEDGAGSSLEIPSDQCVALIGTARSGYPLKMFNALVGVLPAGTDIELGMGDDYPAVVRFEVAHATCSWFVAPWIEGD